MRTSFAPIWRPLKTQEPAFKKYILVCENRRANGEACCGPHSMGKGYVERLKDEVKRLGLKGIVRVSRTGCLDVCTQGPNILVFPDGKWYSNVQEADLDEIIRQELCL